MSFLLPCPGKRWHWRWCCPSVAVLIPRGGLILQRCYGCVCLQWTKCVICQNACETNHFSCQVIGNYSKMFLAFIILCQFSQFAAKQCNFLLTCFFCGIHVHGAGVSVGCVTIISIWRLKWRNADWNELINSVNYNWCKAWSLTSLEQMHLENGAILSK